MPRSLSLQLLRLVAVHRVEQRARVIAQHGFDFARAAWRRRAASTPAPGRRAPGNRRAARRTPRAGGLTTIRAAGRGRAPRAPRRACRRPCACACEPKASASRCRSWLPSTTVALAPSDAHEAQCLERLRAAIHEIADEPQLVAVGGVVAALEQRLQFVAAALDVTDGVAGHVAVTQCSRPGIASRNAAIGASNCSPSSLTIW